MIKAFDRKIKLILSVSDGNITKVITFGGDDTHIEFDISKTSEEASNKATVGVYNISNEKRQWLSINGIGYSSATIIAGYGKSEQVLYIGDVAEIKDDVSEGDLLTTFTLATGFNANQQGESSKSWGAGVSLTQVINSVVDPKLKTGLTATVKSVKDVVFPRGLVMSENPSEFLRKTLTDTGHTVVNEDNNLIIEHNSTVTKVHVINAQTGMVGIPQQITETETDKGGILGKIKDALIGSEPKPTKSKVGYRVTMLLNPAIGCLSHINLTCKRLMINGLMLKVSKVSHNGSNFDNAYYTVVDAFVDEVSV